VHQHTAKELLFEVLLLSSVTQIVQYEGLSSLDQPVEDQSNALSTVLLTATILLSLRDCVLLPLLEVTRHIEVLHPLQNLRKLINSPLLQETSPLDRIPHLSLPCQFVSINNLSIASAQHQCQLRSQEPQLTSLFAPQVVQVLLQH